jgi:hypothetical protein
MNEERSFGSSKALSSVMAMLLRRLVAEPGCLAVWLTIIWTDIRTTPLYQVQVALSPGNKRIKRQEEAKTLDAIRVKLKC